MTYTTKDEYLDAMKNNRRFEQFGVQPRWNPEIPDIDGYIHDEVVRQGHDPTTYYDGRLRINKMRMAWDYARKAAAIRKVPYVVDLIQIARFVEDINAEGLRQHEVRIGRQLAAPAAVLRDLMPVFASALHSVDPKQLNKRTIPEIAELNNLWDQHHYIPEEEFYDRAYDFFAKIETVDDAYICYEAIHPFGDGNGRSGKIMACWIAKRLAKPWMPPNYFGGQTP